MNGCTPIAAWLSQCCVTCNYNKFIVTNKAGGGCVHCHDEKPRLQAGTATSKRSGHPTRWGSEYRQAVNCTRPERHRQ